MTEYVANMAQIVRELETQIYEEEILLVLLLMRRARRRLQAANRVTWSKQWIKRRGKQGAHGNLIRELAAEHPEVFRKFHRMTRESFYELLAMVSRMVSKRDTHLRMSLKPSERLSVTLRFLATGLSFFHLLVSRSRLVL